jgi:hypothetical protein
MKKTATFIPYTLLLFVLFFGNSIVASAQPPPPNGLQEPPPVNIDLYLIPMVAIGIILAFFFIRKNTDV